MRPSRQPVVSVAEGYRRWAPWYEGQPNRLLDLESTARNLLTPPMAGRDVLELGCGTGRVTRELLRAGPSSLLAVDFSPEMLRQLRAANHGPELKIRRMDLLSPRFETKAYDLCIMALVWAHLPRREGLLHAVSHCLRPGGRFILTVLHPAQLAAGRGAHVDPPFGREFVIRTWPWELEETLLAPARALGLDLDGLEETGLPEQKLPAVMGLRFVRRD